MQYLLVCDLTGTVPANWACESSYPQCLSFKNQEEKKIEFLIELEISKLFKDCKVIICEPFRNTREV